jgi:hypothetical protein
VRRLAALPGLTIAIPAPPSDGTPSIDEPAQLTRSGNFRLGRMIFHPGKDYFVVSVFLELCFLPLFFFFVEVVVVSCP